MRPQKDLPTPEDDAFTELYERYAYTLLNFIRRYVFTRVLAFQTDTGDQTQNFHPPFAATIAAFSLVV